MSNITPFNYLSGRDTFSRIREHTKGIMLNYAHKVPSAPWQGREAKPEFATYELMNYSFTHRLNGIEDLDHWREDVKPNLPWADDHFEERVCGAPINPGVEWENWPWGASADSFRDEQGMFNHNYMERYWPKHALQGLPTKDAQSWHDHYNDDYGPGYHVNRGIRNEYGDLNDLVKQLAANPLSRQEWFPIFHPEDVGKVVGGRKPCSLGYQFWVREDRLHCYYPLRSCDFMHHMQDDIYLTLRLMLWVLNKCRSIDSQWDDIKMGTLTMHCTSLHVFANDYIQLQQKGSTG